MLKTVGLLIYYYYIFVEIFCIFMNLFTVILFQFKSTSFVTDKMLLISFEWYYTFLSSNILVHLEIHYRPNGLWMRFYVDNILMNKMIMVPGQQGRPPNHIVLSFVS